ncbi:MAG: membrane protein [Bacteroidia bacterium]|nr:MAG: membrane protein [Bacteroidia bacterium]
MVFFRYLVFLFIIFCGLNFSWVLSQPDIRKKGTKEEKKNNTNIEQAPKTEKSFWQISGKVVDENKEPMIGVYVLIDGTLNGTLTNNEGFFTLTLSENKPVKLRFSYIGYATQFVEVEPESRQEMVITMKEEFLQANEVVISASRIQERIIESPVSIEKMDLVTITESPTLNVYEGLTMLKGIDQLGGSMLFKTINTRGFNSSTNLRFVQMLDGMDMQAPGLNFGIGVLNGASDLDIESVELIPGVASALYGPNAFSGLLNVRTKNPWQFQGASASVKLGVNHLDKYPPQTSPLIDFNARYAKAWNEKWAFKVNFGYLKANDWHATDYRDIANYSGTINTTLPDKPGYDGLNLYGDEVSAVFDATSSGGLVSQPIRIARTGYREVDLVDYNTYNLKADASLHFKIRPNLELIGMGRWNSGTTVYQAVNKISIKEFLYHLYKLEMKGSNFYVRSFVSLEDANKTYDTRFAAINLNRMAKPDEQWFTQYLLVYGNNNFLINAIRGFAGLDPLPAGNDAAARAFADGDNTNVIRILQENQDPFYLSNKPFVDYVFGGKARYQPGTPEFQNAFKTITSQPGFLNGGALFVDKTAMYSTDGQYDFKNLIPFVHLIAGGNFRIFDLNSQGTLFQDSAGNPLSVWEVGAYFQATKNLLNDRLKIIASARADKSKNFQVVFSPRFATVYSFGENKSHNLRVSAQTGFRNPSLQSQYIDLNLGFAKYIGGVRQAFEPYGVDNNYSKESVNQFLTEYQKLLSQGVDTATAINQAAPLLKKLEMKNVRPELIKTFELGYKGLIQQKLYVDAYTYYSLYDYFEGAVDLVAPARKWNENTKSWEFSEFNPQVIADNSAPKAYYRRYYNASKQVSAWGASIGANYNVNNQWALNASYTYAKALFDEKDDSQLIAKFNTPPHKVTAGITGRNFKNWGFSIQYRWQDAFELEESYAQGIVPAFHNLDAQISYKIPSMKTTFRIGATNLLNQRRIEMLGGGTIGVLPYFQVIYDELLR